MPNTFEQSQADEDGRRERRAEKVAQASEKKERRSVSAAGMKGDD